MTRAFRGFARDLSVIDDDVRCVMGSFRFSFVLLKTESAGAGSLPLKNFGIVLTIYLGSTYHENFLQHAIVPDTTLQ